MTNIYDVTIAEAKRQFDETNAQVAELRKVLHERSKVLMTSVFQGFFEQYGDLVKNIFWTQYTPHFNDGEACEFGVNKVYLTLKRHASEDDDDSDDYGRYEGSSLYGEADLAYARVELETMIVWAADPRAATIKHRNEFMVKYNRDPFAATSYPKQTSEERMAEWTPSYRKTVAACEANVKMIEQFISTHRNLKSDFDVVKKMVSDVDEDLMRAMFGDGVTVIVTKTGIETEEHDHD